MKTTARLLLLVLVLPCLLGGCRAARAKALDERLDRIENRLTRIEAQLEARASTPR